ncbi:MAG: SDR family NAD(P)-dependent oxidoreductase [Rhodospirillaceae bacterium]|nr:SDR family NAD(P)-dependent oxidoreductase [Rhodospirillaceae bacterium]
MDTVLITGAGGHVGFALTQKFFHEGWRVFATCLPKDRTAALIETAEQSQGRIRLFDLDVTDAKSVAAVAQAVKDEPIDVLFNVAGLTVRGDLEFGETDYDMWDKHFAVNAKGPMRMCEAFAPHVIRSRRKVMMTISSRMGPKPSYGFVGYRATKSAVSQVMFQVGLALKDQGVIAAACHPGWVKTANNMHQGALTPEQSAAMLYNVVVNLRPEDTCKFFDPDGTTLPLVTQQKDPKPYAMT